MRRSLLLHVVLAGAFISCKKEIKQAVQRPNILFCIADDASFPHMGAYGVTWVSTPGFDRVAKDGLVFMNAYTPNAKCSPSRSAILTGRNSWQLEEAANHWPNFPAKFRTYVEALGDNGYVTGYTGKGWGPGNPGTVNGKPRELTGKVFDGITSPPPTAGISAVDYSANFKVFLDSAAATGKPWCFWYGGREPHRTYEYGSGVEKGKKKLSDIDKVPEFWPDNEVVRNDMLDYAYEVEHFDAHLQRMLADLEAMGQLDNTIIVVTSDNGMPFPRVKGQEYEYSNHMPLAVMWPKGIENPGRKIEEYVSFIDFAPTFMEIAGIKWGNTGMQPTPGRSLTDLFNNTSTKKKPDRDFVVFGKERHDIGRPHDVGYPIRGIVKGDYMYMKNFEISRWPAGNPETGYRNTDSSPTKTVILDMRRSGENTSYWRMSFGKRPEEELYDIKTDPYCLENLAGLPGMAEIKHKLLDQLTDVLKTQQDPRIFGRGEVFDKYPIITKDKDFYERFMRGEKVDRAGVIESDDEKEEIKD